MSRTRQEDRSTSTGPIEGWRFGALAALLTLLVLALAVGSVRLDSATSDEPAYIAAGMIKVLHGRLDFFRDQPPLMNSLSAVPLVLAGYRIPPIWEIGGNHWAIGKRLLHGSGYDAHRMLFLARLPTIALLMALVWAVYVVVFQVTKSRGWGLFAAALTGLCPNVLAHGRLATVDLAVSFFSFAAAAFFVRMMQVPSIASAAGAGALTGAAVLSKTSANVLLPYFAVVLVAALASGVARDRRRVLLMTALAAAVAVVFVAAFIIVEGSDEYAQASFPGVPRLFVPFAEYLENLRAIRGWYTRGADHPQFLLGEFSRQGWWYYYPVAIGLKATIPALLILAMAAAVGFAARRIPFPAAAAVLFVLLFLALASAGELALGLRYVLPVFPFLYAASAIILARVPRLAIPAVALLIWHAGESVLAYPSYLSYFNQTIGSHRHADRYLIDSNLDWGQDLRRLDAWLRDRNIDEVVIHYFGGGVPQFELAAKVIGGYGPGGRPLPGGSWFALSRHYYRVSFDPTVSRETYDQFLRRSRARLVDTVGGSINVYRVE